MIRIIYQPNPITYFKNLVQLKCIISYIQGFGVSPNSFIIYPFTMNLPLLSHPLGTVGPDEVRSRVQNPPNNTIYINNLNEKVPIEQLKDALFNIFEEYGEIIDIIAKRNIRMRGQAFLIFKDINSAMQARRNFNGRELYGKTMKIQFAKEKSDVVAKLDGTFQIRQKPQDYYQLKFEEKFIHRPQQIKARVEREKNVLKKLENSNNLPNHILFCQGLDQTITAQLLTEYFMRFPGLVDVRLAPKNYAFIEYEDEFKAGNALSALNDTQIGGVTIKLSYAKK